MLSISTLLADSIAANTSRPPVSMCIDYSVSLAFSSLPRPARDVLYMIEFLMIDPVSADQGELNKNREALCYIRALSDYSMKESPTVLKCDYFIPLKGIYFHPSFCCVAYIMDMRRTLSSLDDECGKRFIHMKLFPDLYRIAEHQTSRDCLCFLWKWSSCVKVWHKK